MTDIPRHITPKQIRPGDTIRVSAKLGKLTIETVAVVHHLAYWGSQKEWQTADNETIFGQVKDQVPLIELMMVPALVQHITLVARPTTPAERAEALF